MSSLTIHIEGIEGVYALVNDLKEVDQNKAIRRGLKKGADVFKRAGRRNLSQRNNEYTGNLRGSIIAKVSRKGLSAYSGFNRSPKVTEKQGIPQGNHAHLVDRGTKKRYTKKGYYRGIMPASYFWTDARRDEEDKATKAVFDGVLTMAETLKRKYYV